MRKHESTVHTTTSREPFMRLFATSRVGLRRGTSLQSNMAAEMKRVYCPNHPEDLESYSWDPIIHDCILTDENGTEETDGEPEIEATQALVGAAAVKSSKDVLEALAEDDPDYSDDSDDDDYIVS
ncbi:hypothetical protein FGSG_04541 [Fusarium graminearum PH-1]|uniref:Chromosome 2, complete genome n=1 Tax=Gibberella zeae (strain ATCC MYA-4620 / CBS 123657 / FGSC 9075 / NRRL 31084 / PH-1) TaxID=229533 RepID=I1RKX0_GIBZE|nr:hypothetical protein FGSG_04541 [Fusarium graminearum PH-1]ESU08547.1 hypothetical protein FGSG_04541 [Fusarium graminearum PH-1]CEF79574.1 unnamed protein product [Fusarium graminearum]|eukprot:XP_011321046.1 hypothetical protein FGSG_04541 [Fusarium graminearum PH-1]